MDQLTLFQIFTRVVATRSFTRAADILQMPRSSVSTAIAELEARLGIRLLNRTTRVVAPTAEGEEFHERCLAFLAESEELDSLFRSGARQVQGRVRIDLPARIGRLIVAPRLPGLMARWPGLQVELGMTDRAVDLVGEGIDLALRVGPLADSGLRARRLGEIAQINVASPAYLAQYGTPQNPGDLGRHWQVAYASPSTGRVAEWDWQAGAQDKSCAVPWRVSANSAEGYIAAALAGLGLIQIPAYDVAAHIASGELVEIMPAFRPPAMPMHLLFPGRPRGLRRITAVSDWLETVIRAEITG